MGRLAVAGAALLAASCTLADQPTHEQASPDGALVVRAWCEDGCDIPHRRTITVSAASASGPGESLPDDDIAGRVYVAENDGARLVIEWIAPRVVRIAGDCLGDGNNRPLGPWRARGIAFMPVRLSASPICPDPR